MESHFDSSNDALERITGIGQEFELSSVDRLIDKAVRINQHLADLADRRAPQEEILELAHAAIAELDQDCAYRGGAVYVSGTLYRVIPAPDNEEGSIVTTEEVENKVIWSDGFAVSSDGGGIRIGHLFFLPDEQKKTRTEYGLQTLVPTAFAPLDAVTIGHAPSPMEAARNLSVFVTDLIDEVDEVVYNSASAVELLHGLSEIDVYELYPDVPGDILANDLAIYLTELLSFDANVPSHMELRDFYLQEKEGGYDVWIIGSDGRAHGTSRMIAYPKEVEVVQKVRLRESVPTEEKGYDLGLVLRVVHVDGLGEVDEEVVVPMRNVAGIHSLREDF